MQNKETLKRGLNRSVYLNVQILKKLEVIKSHFKLTARNAAIMKCIDFTYREITKHASHPKE